jgi:hypothetical protein
VTLIGQNVDSYRYEDVDFADLLMRQPHRRSGWIRFTISSQDITPMIDTVAGLPNVWRVSFLQAGPDRVLLP